MKHTIRLTVNDRPLEAAVEPRTHLADFLREQLLLTGTHLGCEHGVCGACTVMIDGVPSRACISYAVACDGCEIRTVEGFERAPLMSALRSAFAAHHALQCGYCTPGMLITAYDIVERLPDASELRVREELAGNLCRCTGYAGIVNAIRAVIASPPALEPTARAPLPVALNVGWPRADAESASAPPSTASATPAEAGARHTIVVPVAKDPLWAVLRDVETVARCVPGVSLIGDARATPFAFRMDVALGPMRVGFEGSATIEYRDSERAGRAWGSGHDPRSRSTGEGSLAFRVHDAGDARSRLEVALDYTLSGPLAQFSRGPVVDAVVEQLLERFAHNAAAAARGEAVQHERALGGFGLAVSALWRRVRQWLAR